MKVYLAGPIFTTPQIQLNESMHNMILATGHDPFSPYHASKAVWQGRAPKDCSHDDRKQVLLQNIDNIGDSEMLLANLRGTGGPFTDQGTVWEMGYAVAQGVPILGYIGPDETADNINLMIAGTLDGACQLDGNGEWKLRGFLVGASAYGDWLHRRIAGQFPVDNLIGHEA